MAVEAIKQSSETNGWTFSYGSGDWLNLVDHKSEFRKDFEDRQIHTLLYTVTKKEDHNSYGGIDRTYFQCTYMIGVSSNYNDPDYNFKWENNIKPLIDQKVQLFKDGLSSCEYKFSGTIIQKEFSNTFDNNLDGVILEFTLIKA